MVAPLHYCPVGFRAHNSGNPLPKLQFQPKVEPIQKQAQMLDGDLDIPLPNHPAWKPLIDKGRWRYDRHQPSVEIDDRLPPPGWGNPEGPPNGHRPDDSDGHSGVIIMDM